MLLIPILIPIPILGVEPNQTELSPIRIIGLKVCQEINETRTGEAKERTSKARDNCEIMVKCDLRSLNPSQQQHLIAASLSSFRICLTRSRGESEDR